jgi:hypothetical protein
MEVHPRPTQAYAFCGGARSEQFPYVGDTNIPTTSASAPASRCHAPVWTGTDLFQAADVVDAVVDVATGTPLGGIRNVAGPDVFALDELGRATLAARQDNRTVIIDDTAGVFAGVTGDV